MIINMHKKITQLIMNKFIHNHINAVLLKSFNLPSNSAIIILNGGIGNQIFQYYLGEELRNIYKKKVYFYDIRKSYIVKHNSYIENLFKIKLKKFNPNKINSLLAHIFLSALFLKFNKLFYKAFKFKLISNIFFDESFNFKNLTKKRGIEFYFGTWHSLINKYKFLDKRKSLIFQTKFKLSNIYSSNEDFIALHVRRGDYISSRKTARFHGNLEKSYFIKAVRYIRKKFGELPVLLFSDDYDWLNTNLKEVIPNSFVISSISTSAEEDLFYMTNAKYFILSNSTFSWFAAFLSKKENKFIVLPKYWYNKVKISKDYIYKDWDYKII